MEKMISNRISVILIIILPVFLVGRCREAGTGDQPQKTVMDDLLANKRLQDLGEKLFFDTRLSDPEGQGCISCHAPGMGWTGPDENLNKTTGIYEGAFHGRFSNRKPSSAAYSTFSPVFHAVIEDGAVEFVGGNFWDGRATGNLLGNPAADQALKPFLNPVEQNVADAASLIEKICSSGYTELFNEVGEQIWGVTNVLGSNDVNLQFGIVGIAIAAYESSDKVSPFTSKFDYYLKGEAELTAQEKLGMDLFNGKAQCSSCHPSSIGADGSMPLFTDFRYDNLGFPANPGNPWYAMDEALNSKGASWKDEGLKEFLVTQPQYAMYAEENAGKHRAPTLRNVDKRPYEGFIKAYGHNGYFKNLEDIVHFYNTRDIAPVDKWPEPEIPQNINTDELGNLGLTAEEEAAIVAFMKTLTDGYVER